MNQHSYIPQKPFTPNRICNGYPDEPDHDPLTGQLNIDWDDIRIFQAAVRAGDYTTAGRRLGMDRTTVGRRLGKLEQSLARALWEKSPAGYQPTSLGQSVLKAATQMEQAMIELQRQLGVRESQIEGKIRLAGSAGITDVFLAPIHQFLGRHPNVSIEFAGTQNAIDAVSRRHADLGIAISRECPANLEAYPLGNFHQRLYVSRDDPTNRRRVGWSHGVLLANPYPWALINQSDESDFALEVDNLPAMHRAVRSGVGMAWLWQELGDYDPGLVRLDDPMPEKAEAELWLVTRRDVAVESAVEHLRKDLARAVEMCRGGWHWKGRG